ncbi:MAG: hypothetical protein E7284_03420 [Lachnospiraceae bacterium]|nr:hypothetical protein [Lachnospiraceae bacterium]
MSRIEPPLLSSSSSFSSSTSTSSLSSSSTSTSSTSSTSSSTSTASEGIVDSYEFCERRFLIGPQPTKLNIMINVSAIHKFFFITFSFL